MIKSLPDGTSDELRQLIGNLVHSKYNLRNSPGLNERMRKIILWRFGLGEPYYGFEPSYQNIGNMFGICSVRVRQIEQKALRILHHPSMRKVLLELRQKEQDEQQNSQEDS